MMVAADPDLGVAGSGTNEADGIRLQPANPEMEPIYLGHEELQILGIVAGVVRQG
jgi:SOS-response transcriptional repressor LexA